MKNLTCLPKFLFKTRFVFMGAEGNKDQLEGQIKEAIQPFEPKDDTELLDYTEVEEQAENAIKKKKQQIIDNIRASNESNTKREQSDLDSIQRDTPQGRAEYARKKKEYEANEARRADELKQTEAALNAAATTALNELKKAYDDAEKKRKDAAEEFAKSIASEVVNQQQTKRKQEVDNNAVNNLMNSSGLDSSLFQDDLTLPRYIRDTSGQLKQAQNDANDKPIEPWNKDSVRLATYEMLKAIYMEQGPEAAQNKANELMRATREQGANGKVDIKDSTPQDYDRAIDDFIASLSINPDLATAMFVSDTLDATATEEEEREAHGMVNQASWNKAFGSAVDDVLKEMQFDPNRGAKLFGMVVGNISAAKELFKGNGSVLKRYEAAVRNAVEKGETPFPTPTAWAQKNAPEVFVTEGKPEAFVDKILEAYTIPNNANHEAAVAKRDQVRAMLIGVLSATNDTTKWDSLAREALKTMIGANWNANLINQADPMKIMNGRGNYGQSADKLDDTAKAYISGLIFGAEQEFKDKKIPIIDADKNQTSIGDFIETYKSIVTDMLKTNQVIQSNIDALYEEMLTQVANNNPTSNQEKAEIARIESYYQQQIYDYLKHSLPTPQKVWEEYQQKNKSASDANTTSQADSSGNRDEKKMNSSGAQPASRPKQTTGVSGSASSSPTLPATPTAGAPKAPSAAGTTAPPASASRGEGTSKAESIEPAEPAVPVTPRTDAAPTAAAASGTASGDSSNNSSSSDATPTATSTKETTRENQISPPLQKLLDTAQESLNTFLSSGEGSDATYHNAWAAYLNRDQGAPLRNALPVGQSITFNVSNKKVTLTKHDDVNVKVQVETISSASSDPSTSPQTPSK
jgi:hypothetical protein